MLQPGLCILVLYPVRSRRSCRRKNRENGGCLPQLAGMLMHSRRRRQQNLLRKQILPSIFPVFSLTASNAYSMDREPVCTAPAEASFPSDFAKRFRAGMRGTSPAGIHIGGSGWDVVLREGVSCVEIMLHLFLFV